MYWWEILPCQPVSTFCQQLYGGGGGRTEEIFINQGPRRRAGPRPRLRWGRDGGVVGGGVAPWDRDWGCREAAPVAQTSPARSPVSDCYRGFFFFFNFPFSPLLFLWTWECMRAKRKIISSGRPPVTCRQTPFNQITCLISNHPASFEQRGFLSLLPLSPLPVLKPSSERRMLLFAPPARPVSNPPPEHWCPGRYFSVRRKYFPIYGRTRSVRFYFCQNRSFRWDSCKVLFCANNAPRNYPCCDCLR